MTNCSNGILPNLSSSDAYHYKQYTVNKKMFQKVIDMQSVQLQLCFSLLL